MSETLGERIQALRREVGLSQGQLGERTGLGAPNVRNWEQGHRTPSVFALHKIARALGRSMDDFLDGVEEGEPARPASRPRKGKAGSPGEGPVDGQGAGGKGQAKEHVGKGRSKPPVARRMPRKPPAVPQESPGGKGTGGAAPEEQPAPKGKGRNRRSEE